MRILLVQHQKNIGSAFPLGLGYVAGVLLPLGHQVRYLDLAAATDPAGTLSAAIRDFAPQALGCTLWTRSYGHFLDLMRTVERPGKMVVVAGGPHAGAMPETVLGDRVVDVVVRQEGECVAPPLFRALEQGEDLSSVPGIAFLDKDGQPVLTPDGEVLNDLDGLPDIPWKMFEPLADSVLIRGMPAAPIQTSRGCPFKCVFCYRGPAAGRKYRTRSVSRVVQDLNHLHDAYGFRAFAFFDDIFSLDRARTIALCQALADLPWSPVWTCMTRVDRVDEEVLGHMRRSGCVSISFGVESGSPEILERMGKGIVPAQAEEAMRLCRRVGIPTFAFFVLGTPWETDRTIRQSVDFAKRLRPTNAVFFASTPYPGTRLREIHREMGLPLPEEYAGYSHYRAPWDRGQAASRGGSATLHRKCAAACREYALFQLGNFRDYPRLVRENWRLYGAKGLARRASQLLGLLRPA